MNEMPTIEEVAQGQPVALHPGLNAEEKACAEELLKRCHCLYIAVDSSVADSLMSQARTVIKQMNKAAQLRQDIINLLKGVDLSTESTWHAWLFRRDDMLEKLRK